jgi:type III pantothenate kinase
MEAAAAWVNFTTQNLFNWLYNHPVENIILSSVGHVPDGLIEALKQENTLLVLDENTPIPVENRYMTPATLGRDRLAAVVGAWELFPQKNILVIDAGTCITYDLLLAPGIYLGGNIAPGMGMRLQAMHVFTANLPEAPRPQDFMLIGNSTESALQNGGQWGAILETEGLIARCEEVYGELTLIATGGDAEHFEKNLKRKIFVNPNLVLIGLNKILNYNVQNKT